VLSLPPNIILVCMSLPQELVRGVLISFPASLRVRKFSKLVLFVPMSVSSDLFFKSSIKTY